ncbi:ankyrin repeat domain-containing protein [Streptomyces sp. NPDC050085]|uniref:ankyrin repeat domain-containing protein n=1 Tax=Streptomyces sp. NPDC050085 TaxID=3365600 RepID=UPI0037944AC7
MNDEVRPDVPAVSALYEAVLGGDEDAVVRLLRAGVPGDVCTGSGESVLYRAAMCDEPGIVRLLLAAGADPDRLSEGTDLPLCGAACAGHEEVVRALLAAGARADAVEELGFRALTWAVQLGREAVVRALLDGGADPRLPGAKGELPLVAAARRGSTGCVRALLEHGATGLREALVEARRWRGVEVAEVLRTQVVGSTVDGVGREAVTERFVEDGGVTVAVQLLDASGRPASGAEQQTGHAAIATLLESALGIATPPGELADRAVACGDPGNDDWVEAMEVLRRRGDDGTFRAAAAWCADRDPLRRAFGADVLGQLGVPGPDGSRPFERRTFPVLRAGLRSAKLRSGPAGGAGPSRSAAAPRGATSHDGAAPAHEPETGNDATASQEAELAAFINALGHHRTPAAVPEIAAHAAHPSPAVRRSVALALHTHAPGGHPEAVAALTALARDADPDVRTWAAAGLAGSGADTDEVRETLTALLDDPRTDIAAEAARGLALRQDVRAVDPLARLLAQLPPGDYAREVAQDAARAFDDVRIRNRLEWTLPRRA